MDGRWRSLQRNSYLFSTKGMAWISVLVLRASFVPVVCPGKGRISKIGRLCKYGNTECWLKGTQWNHLLKGKSFTTNNPKPSLLVILFRLVGDTYKSWRILNSYIYRRVELGSPVSSCLKCFRISLLSCCCYFLAYVLILLI